MTVSLDDRSDRYADQAPPPASPCLVSEEDASDKWTEPLSPTGDLHHLIALCYESAFAEDSWSHFAAVLARSLSATRCAAVLLRGNGREPSVSWTHGAFPKRCRDWFPAKVEFPPARRAGSGHQGSARENLQVQTSPDGRFLIGMISSHDAQPGCIVVIRSTEAPDFNPDEMALLGALLPHIGRASRARHAMQESEDARAAMVDVLDRLPEAIFLVDSRGRVSAKNRAARAIAHQNDGLSLVDGCITLALPHEQEALRALIARATESADSSANSSGHLADTVMTMSVRRPSGKTALPLVVTPVLHRRSPDGPPGIVAAVISKDADQHWAVLAPDLAIAFGLTPGESRLAGLVVGGLGLKDAALRLGITRNTIRTHMKRVYAKTGVNSQADLVRLLSRGSIALHLLESDGLPVR